VVLPAFDVAEAQPIRVERTVTRGDSVHLALRMDVAAPPTTVWRALTDYDGMERFVPGVTVSRQRGRTANGLLVEQAGVANSIPGRHRVEALMEMRERVPSLLVFHGIRGTFPRLHGYWRLRPLETGGTRVLYRCTVGLGPNARRVPEQALGWIVQREVTPRVRAIGGEAERRAGKRR
jgi:uncharacterized protein YndB with AHSA1/START domain